MLLSEIKGIQNGRLVTSDDADFKESEHPRESDGKFTEGSGGAKKGSKLSIAIEMHQLLKENASDDKIQKHFTEHFKGKGITDPKYIAKKIVAYKRRAKRLSSMVEEIKKAKPEPEKKEAEKKVKYLKASDEIKVGPMGRGWMIASDLDLIDVTGDFGGGTNDHVGIFQLSSNGEKLGLDPAQIKKLKALELAAEGDWEGDVFNDYALLASELMSDSFKKCAVRVREFDGDDISIQGEKLSIEQVQYLIEKNKIPSKKNGKYTIEGADDPKHDWITNAKLSNLMAVNSWRELRQFTGDAAVLPETNFQGIPIVIENQEGSLRKGKNDEGQPYKTKMFYPYGFIKETEGVDGDEIDCFLGPDPEANMVYIVHSKIDGKYDEDKVMFGFPEELHARDAFLAHYEDASHLGPISSMTVADFKQAIKNHRQGTRIGDRNV